VRAFADRDYLRRLKDPPMKIGFDVVEVLLKTARFAKSAIVEHVSDGETVPLTSKLPYAVAGEMTLPRDFRAVKLKLNNQTEMNLCQANGCPFMS